MKPILIFINFRHFPAFFVRHIHSFSYAIDNSKALIRAQISMLAYHEEYTDKESLNLLKTAGIIIKQI